MYPPDHPKEERISPRHIASYILEQLNLERGLGFTLKKLLLDPREAVQEFLFDDRQPYVKPLPLLLLVTGVTVFISFQFLGLSSDLSEPSIEQEAVLGQLPPSLRPVILQLGQLLRQYFNLILMISLPFSALMTYWIFSEQQLYYTEHLVINTYIYCVQSIFTILLLPLLQLFPITIILLLVLTLGYMTFAITKIFEQKWGAGFLKTLAVYLGSQLMYQVFIILVILVLWVL